MARAQVLRLLENEQVTPEEVDDALKDGLEYYLGGGTPPRPPPPVISMPTCCMQVLCRRVR